VAGQNVVAVSGIATGNVQGVGFRAMIQKQAIQYNLAGSAENNKDKSVLFLLQGPQDRIKAIRKGTKKSSNVKVTLSSAEVKSSLDSFTVFGWTSCQQNTSPILTILCLIGGMMTSSSTSMMLKKCR
jgi:acylphosphatase